MLRLTKHTYVAEIAGGLVFLDLKRDRYTYVAPNDAAEILRLFDRSVEDGAQAGDFRRERGGGETSVLGELKRAGLVAEDGSGRPFRQMTYHAVVKELPRPIGPDRPAIRSAHVWNFVRSVLLAKALLRLLPLHWVVEFVHRRGARRVAVTPYSAAQLTDIYRRLRPLLFSRVDRCLLDSLSLIQFLGCYRVRAGWRFGVRLEPFKAHAWVQDDDTVFDDMAAIVHSYTVILES